MENEQPPAAAQRTPHSTWRGLPMPAMRLEAHFGDRVVRCFAQRPASVHALLEEAVAHAPELEAVVCGESRWTWRELDARVARTAGALAAAGIAAGDRVALFVGNRPEFVTLVFAIQRLGAICVPVGTREQRAGLVYMLNQCGAAGLVYDAALEDRVPPASASAGNDAPEGAGVPEETEVSSLRLRVSVESLPGMEQRARPVDTPARAAPEDCAFILYTSGTTGHPKGAMLTHINVAHSVLHFQHGMGLRAGDRSALAVPASHVTGLVAVILSMARVAGTIVVVPQFKAADFVPLMARERITHTLIVPAMYALILLEPGLGKADLSAWRVGGYGGAPMPMPTIDALAECLPGLSLLNCYGSTETTSPTTMMPPGHARSHIDTVGVPLPCAQVIAVDGEGRELPPGETGELWIGGPMVVPGYWDNPQATRNGFVAGWWRSGDIGSVDVDGFVRVFDRMKDMLNRGGYKVYSAEVEGALMALPGVAEAAVVGKPCPVLGERVHAFVHVPDANLRAGLDAPRVRAHCAALLADYKVPETVTFTDEPLPRNANGKLLKRVLRER